MKKLSKETYYHIEKVKDAEGNDTKQILKDELEMPIIRVWHDCKNFKKGKRGVFRNELSLKEFDSDTSVYVCPHCEYTYTLDRHLNLA